MLIASLIICQALIFAGLIFVFRRIMTQNVVSATRHIEELNQDYTKKEQQINSRLEQIKQESQDILSKAQEEAQKLKTDILKEAEAEKEKIISQSRQQGTEIIQQADRSRQALITELEERISKEAIDKACELIQSSLPEQLKHNVHMHWVEELTKDDFKQLERLRIPKDARQVKITSPFPLNEQQRKALLKKLKGTIGRDVTLKEEINPKVVAGIIINIGDLLLDGSLRSKIRDQSKTI